MPSKPDYFCYLCGTEHPVGTRCPELKDISGGAAFGRHNYSISRHELIELLERLFHNLHNLKEIKVSQVQFNLNVSIVAPVQPLAESASSGDATFTQGQAGSFTLAQITGGQPPYSVALDPQSPAQLPSGVSASIDSSNNLVLSGTTSDAPETGVAVLLDVTDSDGQSVAKVAANVQRVNAPPPPKPE